MPSADILVRLGLSVLILGAAAQRAAGAEPAPVWDGCYIGGQIGFAHAQSHWDYTNSNPYTATGNADPQLIAGADFHRSRAVAGGQLGCNTTLSGPWMVGLEAAWIGNPLNITQDNSGFTLTGPGGGLTLTEAITTNVNAIASATARIGVAVAPDLLVYGKGGLALGRITTSGAVSPSVPEFDWSDTRWHPGWTVGAGVEFWLLPNLSLGLEYDYYRFATRDHVGLVSATDIGPGGVVSTANPVLHRVGADAHTIMARINIYDPLMQRAAVAALPSRFEGTFSAFAQSETKYSNWHGTRGTNTLAPDPGRGYQVYSPTTIGIDYELASQLKLETRFKGGYVYSHHGTPNQTATYTGPVDSQVSFNASFLSFETIRPLLGVSMNLPTGTSYLPGNLRFTRMDPDLVDIESYGVGFNVNPTAGFLFALNERTVLSVSGGYAWQGVFIKEGVDLSTGNGFGTFDLKRRINPADVFTANGNLATSFGENDKLEVSFAYMSEGRATIDGVASGRAGAKYVTNAAFDYKLDPQWTLGLNGSWTFQEKNEIVDPAGALVGEPKNSNSHVLIGSVDPSYQVNERLRLGANYSIMWRSHNFYDPIEERFIPAKLKNTAGLSARYLLTEKASLTVRGSHSWVQENIGAFLPTSTLPPAFANLPPSMSFSVWALSIGATAEF